MIVDDDDDALFLSRRLVQQAAPDAMVVTTVGARNAMAHLLQASNPDDVMTLMPDVMLLDLSMPNVNGFQVIERLKGTTNPPAIIIVTVWRFAPYFMIVFLALFALGWAIRRGLV